MNKNQTDAAYVKLKKPTTKAQNKNLYQTICKTLNILYYQNTQ